MRHGDAAAWSWAPAALVLDALPKRRIALAVQAADVVATGAGVAAEEAVSGVYFVSDLHLGHCSIVKHSEGRRGGTMTAEHDAWVIKQCFSVRPNKRTLWWMLGDVAMAVERLPLLDELPGQKWLVLGNHDKFDVGVYAKHFQRVFGGVKRYGMWITHIPMHPDELRGKPNIHGHCHKNELAGDARYFNAAIEWLPNQRPVSLDWLRERWKL